MILLISLILLFSVVYFLGFLHSGYMISPEDEIAINKVLSSPTPKFNLGVPNVATSPDGTKIYYESIGEPKSTKGNILLINGLGLSLLDWPPYFLTPLINAGYHVIRMDNRDVGLSDWITDWGKGRYYNLEHMSQDALSVMDQLGIQSFHLVGLSMGGMISQHIAINYPKRVLSLCSIMSSGHFYDPELTNLSPSFKKEILRILIRYNTIKSKKNTLKSQLCIQHLLKGKGSYVIDNEFVFARSKYEIENRKGFNPKASRQQGVAIAKSGSRYKGLKELSIPCLVIHGNDDPLIYVDHAHKYAGMIPEASLMIIDGMGHDLPERYTQSITEAILININKTK